MAGAAGTLIGSWWVRLLSWAGWSRAPGGGSAGSAPPIAQFGDIQPLPVEPAGETAAPVAAASAPVRPAILPAAPEVRQRTLDALGGLQQIPALQSFARNFLSLLNRTDVDVADVIEVIAKDSALCVRVLRLANSVEVSPGSPIDDLHTAVQMLGINRVRRTAQTVFTLRDGNRVADGFDWRHLWLHAIGTAELAGELDLRLRGEAPPALHVAALLHDVGKIVLSMVAPEDYRQILAAAWREDGALEELERARLGVDHREAGKIFALQAGMPEMAVQAIAFHDEPERAESFRYEVALVSVANHLSKAQGLGFSGSRLDANGVDFSSLPAWAVIEAELGRPARPEEFEGEMMAFAANVRADLRDLPV